MNLGQPCLLFPVFSCFDIWAAANLEGTTLPRVSQFLEMIDNWPLSAPFKCKPTSPDPTPLITFPTRLSHSSALSTCPDQTARDPSFPGPRAQ